jgi:acyl carrier protein
VAESHQLHGRSELSTAYVAPRSVLEERLACVWAEVLGFEQIGVEDDFFRLGGHSISAIRIVARLRDSLGAEISVADLLTNPTVVQFSAFIASQATVPPTGEQLDHRLLLAGDTSAAEVMFVKVPSQDSDG